VGSKLARGKSRGKDMVLAVLAMAPVVTIVVLVPESRGLVQVTGMIRVVAGLLTVLGALLLYLWWREADRPEPAWLVAAVTFTSVQTLATVALTLSSDPYVAERPGWLALTQLMAALVLLGMVLAARRAPLGTDPGLLGLSSALLIAGIQVGIMRGSAPLGLPDWALTLVVGGVGATYLVAGLVVMRLPMLPSWSVPAVGIVTALLAVGHLGGAPLGLGEPFGLAAACAHLLAAAVLLTTALTLLHREVTRWRHDVGTLNRQLHQIESAGRDDRAKLHEIRTTLAGITTASQMLHERHVQLDDATRLRLQRSVRSEMARLQRLMDDRPAPGPTAIDLDETLDPLLEAHRARGHRVQWRPSGHQVHARPDDVTEAVNILLENAAKHAEGSDSHLGVAHDGDEVLISVSDSGPGIPSQLHHEIFDWGVRGDASSGQGIGLYVARRLVSEQGGSLTVTTPPGSGTTFTIRLPAARTTEENHDHDGHLAS
jgi:signal transduction histidine kinase